MGSFISWLRAPEDVPPSTPVHSRVSQPIEEFVNESMILEFREAFDHFDADSSGFIEKPELRLLFERFGRAVTEDEVDSIFKLADPSGDGKIDFWEVRANPDTCALVSHVCRGTVRVAHRGSRPRRGVVAVCDADGAPDAIGRRRERLGQGRLQHL